MVATDIVVADDVKDDAQARQDGPRKSLRCGVLDRMQRGCVYGSRSSVVFLIKVVSGVKRLLGASKYPISKHQRLCSGYSPTSADASIPKLL